MRDSTFLSFRNINFLVCLPVVDVDVDANVCVGVDDGVTPVVSTVTVVPLGQHDPKIDYLIHGEDGQLDQLNLFFDLIEAHIHTDIVKTHAAKLISQKMENQFSACFKKIAKGITKGIKCNLPLLD